MGRSCIGSSYKGMKYHSFTQSNCRLLPKERSQPRGALSLHPLPWVSSSHLIDWDELEQLTNPAQNNTLSPVPSLQASFSVRSVSTCGCNTLVGALGSGTVLPLNCVTECRADAKCSFCSTVIFSQIKPTALEGHFPPLYRCTEACQKKGKDGEGEAVKPSCQHSSAQSRSYQNGHRQLSVP